MNNDVKALIHEVLMAAPIKGMNDASITGRIIDTIIELSMELDAAKCRIEELKVTLNAE